jgi:hypothetical protein
LIDICSEISLAKIDVCASDNRRSVSNEACERTKNTHLGNIYILYLGASFVLMFVKDAHFRNHLPAFTDAIRPINHTGSYSTECIGINSNVKTDSYFSVYLQISVYADVPVLNVLISTL